MGYSVKYQKILFLAAVALILLFEQTGANQMEIAKKYGKRFGNKNKQNNSTTDSKETDKTVKAVASEITKTLTRSPVLDPTEAPEIKRQQRFSKSQTTTSTTTPAVPITTAQPKTDDDQEEVDVDLSQLQVSLPNVKFDCGSRAEGYYGDPDYRCEVFHYCGANNKRDTFLCPSNSKFNQRDMTCDTDAIEDLCLPEPAWGQSHMYPTQSAPVLSHVSPLEINKNSKDKVQIEVTAPKFETKENGFREPVYDVKGRDEPKPSQTNTNPINDNNYGKEGNENNYSNNKLKDNYNNNNNNNNDENNSNNNNKGIKSNNFGGSFGERQRTNGLLGSSATVATGANDHNSRKNSQMNGNNNNNYKNLHLSSDFGTVSDANKKVYNKEENGNTNRVTTSPRQPPMVVTLSTTTDSEHYRSKQQSFTSNSHPFDRPNIPVIQSSDFNNVRNNNNKITYESTHSEQYIPSTAPDKSYLLPPPITSESPSATPPQKTFTNVRNSPVHTLPASISTRPAVKWPKKQNSDSYVTEIVRFELTTVPPPPPQTSSPRQYKPAKEEFAQKPVDAPMDVWPERDNFNQNYEPIKYVPIHHQSTQLAPQLPAAQAGPPKQIQSEQMEILHPNWLPLSHSGQYFNNQGNNQNLQSNNRGPARGHPHKNWDNIEKQPQRRPPQQQQEHEPFAQDQYLQNKEKPYNYPALHHTIEPSTGPVDNHLWSSDDRQTQTEVDYRPKNRNSFQSLTPLKPKWAQEMMTDVDQRPQMQAMSEFTQPMMSQSSQPQKYKNLRTGHKSKSFSPNRKAVKLEEADLFGTQSGFSSYDTTLTDYFNMKPNKALSKPMNMFYDQFRPYNIAENSPTEYVKKLTETEKQMMDENQEQNKENIKTVLKNKSKTQTSTHDSNFGTKSRTPTQMEELKLEKDFTLPSDSGKNSGYVPEILPDFMTEEEYTSMTMPERHVIPKLHKPKPKAMNIKHHPNRFSPSKQQFVTSNLFDELLTEENNWALKNLDTSGLDAAFSHNYPMMPLSLPNQRPRKMPKIPKTAFTTPMVTHLTPPNRFLLGTSLPPRPAIQAQPMYQSQPAFYMPQPMPFPAQFQAQQTMPFPYYMPYYPTPQQTKISTQVVKPPKTNTKQSKNKSNSPKIFKF